MIQIVKITAPNFIPYLSLISVIRSETDLISLLNLFLGFFLWGRGYPIRRRPRRNACNKWMPPSNFM